MRSLSGARGFGMEEAGLKDGHQHGHLDAGYRRIEVITGAERRRRWSAEEKARIVAESLQPGVRIAEVARQHGVSRSLLFNWRRAVRELHAGDEQAFVPIRIVAEASTAEPMVAERRRGSEPGTAALAPAAGSRSSGGSIAIAMGEVRVRISGVVDAATLREVLRELRRR